MATVNFDICFWGKFFSNMPSYRVSEPRGDFEEEHCNKKCITRSEFRAWVELLQRVEEDLAATKQEVEGRREMEQLRKQREKRGGEEEK